jgi:hypothetical protein
MNKALSSGLAEVIINFEASEYLSFDKVFTISLILYFHLSSAENPV